MTRRAAGASGRSWRPDPVVPDHVDHADPFADFVSAAADLGRHALRPRWPAVLSVRIDAALILVAGAIITIVASGWLQ